MSYKPPVGGTKWTEHSEAAKAYWEEAFAFKKAMTEFIASEIMLDPKLRNKWLNLAEGLGDALLGLRSELHELEVIGIEAKRERLDDG